MVQINKIKNVQLLKKMRSAGLSQLRRIRGGELNTIGRVGIINDLLKIRKALRGNS